MSKKKNGNPPKPAGKEFSLDERELSSIATYAKQMQLKRMEVNHWQGEISVLKSQILQRLGGKPKTHVLDDSQVFITGKVYLKKIKTPKVKMGKEERRPNGKPELPKK